MKIKASYLFACLASIFCCQCGRQPNAYDGFESATISSIWDESKHIPGVVEIQTGIVRAGKSAVKISMHPGDQIEQEKGTIIERAELMEKRRFWPYEDSSYAYSFSVFLPKDFPVVPNRLVIAQWKQRCPGSNCDPENPVLALRYMAGELLVTHKVTAKEEVLYRTKEEIRGKWLDFRFHLRFSKQNGVIRAWLNEQAIVDYGGPNAYPATGGYPEHNRFYFKFGIYRDKSPETVALYFDEFRREKLAGI